MNKLILLLLIFSISAFAGGEDGTGTPQTTPSENVTYQLVCTPVTDQNESEICILVEVATEE